MKNKAIYIVFTVLEAALVVAPFVLNYFSRAKLGMNRWLVHQNHVWESSIPIDSLEIALLVLLVACMVGELVMLVKSRRKRTIVLASIVLSFGVVGATIWFALSFSPSSVRAYYLIVLCLTLACCIQVVKSIVFAGFMSRNHHARQ